MPVPEPGGVDVADALLVLALVVLVVLLALLES